MLMLAAPLARLVAVEVKPPPERVTLPVAAEVPPDTVTATVIASVVLMLDLEGETVTLGVVLPPPLLVVVLLPQPAAVNVAAMTTSMRLRALRLRREPSGTQKSKNAANALPP